MYKLKNSGLPLYMDEGSHVIALSGLLKFDGMGRKAVGKMRGGMRARDETKEWKGGKVEEWTGGRVKSGRV